ncbi:PglD-related sugar-binding protein [Faecalibacter rhinopitheci]|uniref:Transferase n=1 Tax=Faecalibacter rhinopitheci TaxID=2779678 RepID=A0A8J7FPQ2_9FLAO|nr:transferase [Faecalibacter rhinopitheci]MBF0597495.1 transferase [Faecalibacter rhinopitheci]
MNNDKEIYIVGIGHNTGVTIELAELSGYKVVGLLHYNHELVGQERWGFPIVSQTDDFLNNNISYLNFALSMGDNQIRKDVFEKIRTKGGNFPNLIHPSAVVSRFSSLEIGVQVHANSTIQSDVLIKQNSIISYGVGITHNVEVGEHCYIAGYSIIGAYTKVYNNVFVGMGTVTVSGKVTYIGENAYIGAGSLVINNIEQNSKVYGRPAK